MKQERGAILLFAFIVMVALAVLVGSFLLMVSTQTLGSGGGLAGAQALWVAEGGIQQALYNLKDDAGFRASPTTVTGSLGEGNYSVAVSKTGYSYTLTSTSTVSSLQRAVTQTAKVMPAAFSYAIFGNTDNKTLKLKDDTIISGDLYYEEDVEVQADASVINGLVYADNVTGDGTYTAAGGDPSPVPTYPALDTTTYDNAISTAEATASSNLTLSGSSNLDLAGGTVYYKEVTIKNSATVTGPGTIVATKAVKLKNNANIGSEVTIITKKAITAQNNAVVQSDSVLYGRNGVTLKSSANVTGSLLAPTNNKTVTVKDSAIFTGLIYGDKVKLRNSAALTGTVIADRYTDDKITGSVTVTFDADSIPDTIPTGFSASTVSVTPQKDWDEIAP